MARTKKNTPTDCLTASWTQTPKGFYKIFPYYQELKDDALPDFNKAIGAYLPLDTGMIEFYILKRKYDWSIAEELIYSGDKNDKAEIKRRRDICIKLEHQASLWSKARYSDSISAGFDAEDLLWKKFMKPYI